MDLRIKNNNATKSYVITNNCTTRPRVCMKSDTGVPATPISYLPLTTSTTQGLALRAKVNDQSYRALEFRSMSGSATFYSSNANGQGLSSTTALTRASTSRTEYLTQSSTSRTEYLTRSSTSATSYLTRSSTSGESYLTALGTNTLLTIIVSSYDYGTYQPTGIVRYYFSTYLGTITKMAAASLRTNFIPYGGSFVNTDGWRYDGYYHISGSFRPIGTGTFSYSGKAQSFGGSTLSWSSTTANGYNAYLQSGTRINTWGNPRLSSLNNVANAYYNSLQTINDKMLFIVSNRWETAYTDRTAGQDYSVTLTRNINTTSTSYLTRSSTSSTVYYTRSSTYDTVYYTRSSTYSTIYHTRSSTSGYSGVSSSSSETSGWQ